jgi:hypothetical protein
MLENANSYLTRNWPAGESLTLQELRKRMTAALPPLPAPEIRPSEPVKVVTEWSGPLADGIREQIAAGNARWSGSS